MGDAKVNLAEFNGAFVRARDRVHSDEGADIEAEQAALRALVPENASEHDQGWTGRLIESLAEPPAPPRQWSEYYHQAGEVHAAAYRANGSVDEDRRPRRCPPQDLGDRRACTGRRGDPHQGHDQGSGAPREGVARSQLAGRGVARTGGLS